MKRWGVTLCRAELVGWLWFRRLWSMMKDGKLVWTHTIQIIMSAPLVVRQVMVLPLHHYQHLTVGVVAAPHRLWCSGTTNPESELGRSDELFRAICNSRSYQLRAKDPLSYSRWDRDDPDYRKWRDKEYEILKDIEPIVMLTKDILHSPRSVCYSSFLLILSFSLLVLK